ncbi:hypothetical protein V1478_005419 [Vespula squamosa]|uniref:Uncharacterized protein n=1 Tax=Vespula squamosa TaxID=30214 RepID=A0ABD2BE44_VESSQ
MSSEICLALKMLGQQQVSDTSAPFAIGKVPDSIFPSHSRFFIESFVLLPSLESRIRYDIIRSLQRLIYLKDHQQVFESVNSHWQHSKEEFANDDVSISTSTAGAPNEQNKYAGACKSRTLYEGTMEKKESGNDREDYTEVEYEKKQDTEDEKDKKKPIVIDDAQPGRYLSSANFTGGEKESSSTGFRRPIPFRSRPRVRRYLPCTTTDENREESRNGCDGQGTRPRTRSATA